MSFHLVAFHKAIAAGGAPESLSPVSDDVLSSSGASLIYSQNASIFAAFAMGDSLNLAGLSSSSLESISVPLVRPLVSAAAMPTDPNLAEWLNNAIVVPGGEPFLGFAARGGAGTLSAYVLAWLSSGLGGPTPQGQLLTILGENTTTSTVANTWTDVPLTWNPDNPLAPGRYAMVGSECISASALAFRWKFDNQGLRHGGLSQASVGDRTHAYFSVGGTLGVWGEFTAYVMPRLQILSTANAAQPHSVYVRAIRIGD